MPDEENVGLDSLWCVCLIEGVEDPAVLCQRRSFRQGNAKGVSPACSSTMVERASRWVVHEGSVRVMAKGAGGRAPAGDEKDALWRSGHGPSGQDPKDERRKEVS